LLSVCYIFDEKAQKFQVVVILKISSFDFFVVVVFLPRLLLFYCLQTPQLIQHIFTE